MSNEFDRNEQEKGKSEFSLESILAEFKGTAYIDGDKKTPRNELNKKTEQIVFETTGRHLSAELSSAQDSEDDEFDTLVRLVNRHSSEDGGREQKQPGVQNSGRHAVSREISDEDAAFFERFMYAHPGTPRHFSPVDGTGTHAKSGRAAAAADKPQKRAAKEEGGLFGVAAAGLNSDEPGQRSNADGAGRGAAEHGAAETEDDWMSSFERRAGRPHWRQPYVREKTEDEAPYDGTVPGAFAPETDGGGKDAQPRGFRGSGILARLFGHARYTEETDGDDDSGPDDDLPEEWEEPEEEPDLLREARRFATGVRMLSIRTAAGFFITLVMLLFTVFYEKKGAFPFGIGSEFVLLTGIMAVLLLLVMALAIDVLIDGVSDLFRGVPGCETLAAISSIAAVACAIVLIVNGDGSFGIPMCIVPAFSLCYAMRGKRLYRTAMANSLSAASSKAVKYGIIRDSGTIEDRSVLKKVTGKTGGFYRQITQADICERIYGVAAPLLMIAALIFAAVTAIGGRGFSGFLYALSALLAVSASFTAFTAFPLPFETVARKTKNTGGVVAGWGGASEIHDADGAIITDDDVFPIGTVSLQSYRVMEGVAENKAIAYASSLVVASGSGLSKVFSEFMRGMGLALTRVEDFACYEGGIGAVVRGEQVLVGTAGFMNLMSVRIPGGVNIKNTLFAAIGGELAALFAVNYTPANSVQNALIALIRTRSPMIFAVKDFNVTPAMLRQKFKVSVSDIEYIPSKDCYRLSDDSDADHYDAAAVIFREGLGPFADLIRRGRQLHTLTLLASVVSVTGAYIGMLIVFALCWLGAYISASAINVLFYMMAIHLPLMFLVKRIAGSK